MQLTDYCVEDILGHFSFDGMAIVRGIVENERDGAADRSKIEKGEPTRGLLHVRTPQEIISNVLSVPGAQIVVIERTVPATAEANAEAEEYSTAVGFSSEAMSIAGLEIEPAPQETRQILGHYTYYTHGEICPEGEKELVEKFRTSMHLQPDVRIGVVDEAVIKKSVKDLTGIPGYAFYIQMTNYMAAEAISDNCRYMIATVRDGNTAEKAHKRCGWKELEGVTINYPDPEAKNPDGTPITRTLKILFIDLKDWRPLPVAEEFAIPVENLDQD